MKKKPIDPTAARYVPDLTAEEQARLLHPERDDWSVEDIAMGLHALQVVSGKPQKDFRALCGRMAAELGVLLERDEVPTFETRKEIYKVLKDFFDALGRSPWPTWEEMCAHPDFAASPNSQPSKKSPPRAA